MTDQDHTIYETAPAGVLPTEGEAEAEYTSGSSTAASEQEPQGENEAPSEPVNGPEAAKPSGAETSDDAERGEDEASQGTPASQNGWIPPASTKLIISLNGTRATIGVKRSDTDPFIEALYEMDCISTVLQHAAGTIDRAERYWEANPRHPRLNTTKKPRRSRNRAAPTTPTVPAPDERSQAEAERPEEEPAHTVQASLF